MKTMALNRCLAVALCFASVFALSYGCSSSSVPDKSDTGSSDNDADTDTGSGTGDDGPAPPMVCTPTKPLIKVAYAPPTPFYQGLCTATQTDAYVKAFKANDPNEFRSIEANASCLTCIETLVTASKHGPVITGTVNGKFEVLQTNYGGCVANFIGDSSDSGCGELLDGYNNCALQECGDCSDWFQGGKKAVACLQTAVASGQTCEPYWNSKVQACQNDLASGPATICVTLNDFLLTWCGKAKHEDAGTSTDGGSSG
jgi:hypothetical protein